METKKDRKSIIFSLYVTSYAFLCFLYLYYVSPTWEYYGFNLQINSAKIATSIGVILIFVLITPTRPSARNYLLNLALTTSLLPSLVLYALANMPTSSALIIWMALAIVYVVSAIPIPRIIAAQISPKALLWVVMFILAGVLCAFLAFGGLGSFNLDIRRVYDFRSQATLSTPYIFSYIGPISAKIIIPFATALSLFYRKFFFTFIVIVLSILLFGFTNHKSVLVYPILTCAIFYMLSFSPKYSVILIIFISNLIIAALDVFAFYNFEPGSVSGWYTSLFVRRALMVPALLDYHYIEFFSENPRYLWAMSRISLGLVDSPHDLAAPFIIGEAYYNSVGTAANTGYIGSGYAQAGIVGVALYAIGVGFVIGIVQSYGKYLGVPFVAAIMTSQAIVMFSTTDFVTLFLTHGLIVSLLLLSVSKPPAVSARRPRPIALPTP